MSYGFNVTSHRRLQRDFPMLAVVTAVDVGNVPIVSQRSHLVGAVGSVDVASTSGDVTVVINRLRGGTLVAVATLTILQDEFSGVLQPTAFAKGGVDPNVFKQGDAISAVVSGAGTGATQLSVSVVEHVDADKSS